MRQNNIRKDYTVTTDKTADICALDFNYEVIQGAYERSLIINVFTRKETYK
jgi:hypothetical protein